MPSFKNLSEQPTLIPCFLTVTISKIVPNSHSTYSAVLTHCQEHKATLVAVSKTRSIQQTTTLYDMGQRIFAENRAQELISKAPQMPADVEWHIIGHLQTNKVRAIMPFVQCIQSLDSERLFEKIDTEALNAGKKMRCLLQIKVASEDSKYGWTYDALGEFLKAKKHLNYKNIILEGVMGMTTLTDDQTIIRKELRQLSVMFDQIKADHFTKDDRFNTLSMGMSGDYKIALEEGSTMVRVGSLLFS